MNTRLRAKKTKEELRKTRKTYFADENTLSDSNWLDSFDKFIRDKRLQKEQDAPRPAKDVRVSFNRDSSVFESSGSVWSPAPPKVSRKTLRRLKSTGDAILASTPLNMTRTARRNGRTTVFDGISPVCPTNDTPLALARSDVPPSPVVFPSVNSPSVEIVSATKMPSPKRILVEIPRKSVRVKIEIPDKKQRKTVAFKDASGNDSSVEVVQPRPTIVLAAGKWRKSLANWRKSQRNNSNGNISGNTSAIRPGHRRKTVWIADSIVSTSKRVLFPRIFSNFPLFSCIFQEEENSGKFAVILAVQITPAASDVFGWVLWRCSREICANKKKKEASVSIFFGSPPFFPS
ncbi:uncharacterized protein LOC132262322 [Phlebotomus argentipes]|uniref:uncharacterized protein LOC132262322 n=1 Tax=Phlebotomus argentipes TaxID=94469 RepID=UPI002892BDCF|nr:uncharacterized protein LOC132262322 [Phlebotomus argentipes]